MLLLCDHTDTLYLCKQNFMDRCIMGIVYISPTMMFCWNDPHEYFKLRTLVWKSQVKVRTPIMHILRTINKEWSLVWQWFAMLASFLILDESFLLVTSAIHLITMVPTCPLGLAQAKVRLNSLIRPYSLYVHLLASKWCKTLTKPIQQLMVV